LIIVVTDANGAIQGKYIGTAASNTNSKLEGTPLSTKMSVSITGLTGPATYTVYAFANTLGLWTMVTGNDGISNLATALSGESPVITAASQLEALQFQPSQAELEDGRLLLKNNRLPLSAKGTVTLKQSGNGEIALSLLRCVAKVTAVFENQYGEDLDLTSFSNAFLHMNPSSGYVVPHGEDFAVEWESAGALEAGESSLPIGSVDNPQTEAREDQVFKSWYVFPSIGPYACNVSFTMGGKPHSYTNLQVHDDHGRDISQLARNQHLTITTRISKGERVSFNFEVAGWDHKAEGVTFN
jgi:hypothetical protein